MLRDATTIDERKVLLVRLELASVTNPAGAYRQALHELASANDTRYHDSLTSLIARSRERAQSQQIREALTRTWVERAARGDRHSPLADLHSLLDETIKDPGWRARNMLSHADMDDTRIRGTADLLTNANPDALGTISIDELLECAPSTAPESAAVTAWRSRALAAVHTARNWTTEYVHTWSTSTRLAVVTGEKTTWHYIAPEVHAAWSRHQLADVALQVPLGVAKGLTAEVPGMNWHPAFVYCEATVPLTDTELDIVNQLARDANGQPENLEQVIDIARALAKR